MRVCIPTWGVNHEDEEPGNTEKVIEISQERIATTTNHYRKTVEPVIMIIIDKHSIAAAIRDARFPNGYPIKEIAKQLELDAIAHLQAMGITEGTYTVKAGDLKYDIVEDKQGNPVIKAVKSRKSRRNV